MALTEMERKVDRLWQTIYGDNGKGLRHKVDKIDKKLTIFWATIFGLQVALSAFLILQQIKDSVE